MTSGKRMTTTNTPDNFSYSRKKRIARKGFLGIFRTSRYISATGKKTRRKTSIYSYQKKKAAIHTVSFFRPFFLRRLKTFLPDLEAMRFLKPCAFFPFKFVFGFKFFFTFPPVIFFYCRVNFNIRVRNVNI